MDVRIVEGDLLDQDVEVIVNAWNRNLNPWWRDRGSQENAEGGLGGGETLKRQLEYG